MNEYLRNCSHNSHHQIYTSNRIFIPETQNNGRATENPAWLLYARKTCEIDKWKVVFCVWTENIPARKLLKKCQVLF